MKMNKVEIWKWVLLAALVASSLYIALPLDKKILLGLDIKGGTSFTVEIDEGAISSRIRQDGPEFSPEQVQEKVVKELEGSQKRALEIIRNRVDGLGISEPVIYAEKANRIIVQLPGIDEVKRKEAENAIKQVAFLEFRLVNEKSDNLIKTRLFEKELAPPGYVLVSQGDRQFYMLNEKDVPMKDRDREFLEKQRRFHAPIDSELLLEKEVIDGRTYYAPYFVERKAQLTGGELKKAWKNLDELGQPVVDIQFDGEGKRKFAKVTRDYGPGGDKNSAQIGRQLGIVLDGTLYSAPVIREPITGGNAVISGKFTHEEAATLATVLQAGSLPAPVQIVEKRIVDPTLGADSVKSGISAGIMGCLAIVALMALYYMANGLIADIALTLNIILLPLGMILVAGFLGILSSEARAGAKIALPVLTLPGIAGIALTIGMAVDANVLIFERMREELRTGKGFSSVVQAGFDRAFSAIFDSNITTILTAVILFLFGTGPVRGYAVTLTGGLIVSLFTAVVVTRMCYNLIGTRTESLSVFRMMSAIKATSFNFIGYWKPAIATSLVVIIASWSLMTIHARKNPSSVYGVDFTGGSSITMGFGQKQDVAALRNALSEVGIADATIQYQKEMEGSKETLQVKVANTKEGTLAEETLAKVFPTAGFKLLQQDDVGPQISKDLKKKAITAMGLSLIAIILYMTIRFKFCFALGAVVALFHDVLITAGLVHAFGFQINLTVLAALMTIVGYSVNDTIVIFDRVRENLRLYRNKTFVEICNQSINETLSRTLLTNFLTFVSVLFLLFLGGESLRDFSAAMFIGMIAGTYSTVYIATPVMLFWTKFKRPDLGSSLSK